MFFGNPIREFLVKMVTRLSLVRHASEKVKINTFIANSDRVFGPEIEVNKFSYDCVI